MTRLSRFLSEIVISVQSIFRNQRICVESKQEELNGDIPRQKCNNSMYICRGNRNKIQEKMQKLCGGYNRDESAKGNFQ